MQLITSRPPAKPGIPRLCVHVMYHNKNVSSGLPVVSGFQMSLINRVSLPLWPGISVLGGLLQWQVAYHSVFM